MSKTLIERLHGLPASQRQYPAGKRIFRQGDKVLVVHQILDGNAHLVRHHADGSALVLQRAGSQAILAEASVFAERYHCDAVAVAPTRTRAIDKSALRKAFTQDPDLAEAWAAHLAREVQATRLRAEILSLKTVAQRLDAWIAANDGRFPAKGDWKTVAAEIGTSPEALYREIAKRRARQLPSSTFRDAP